MSKRAVLLTVMAGAVVVAVTSVVLSMRGLDQAGARTCATFASSGYPDAPDPAVRAAIAAETQARAAESRVDALAEHADRLTAATGSAEQWRTATAAMDRACSDAGWVPDWDG